MLFIAFVCERVFMWHGIKTQTLRIKNLYYFERISSDSSISETMFSQQNVNVTASFIYRSVSLLYAFSNRLPSPESFWSKPKEQKTQTAKN